MSEYEIFGPDDDYEQEKPRKKQKQRKPKTECKALNFFKEAFSLNYLAITLSVFSLLFTMFMGFIPLVAATRAAMQTISAFFFLGFALALAGLIIEAVKMILNKKAQFNVNLVFVIVALLASCIILFI